MAKKVTKSQKKNSSALPRSRALKSSGMSSTKRSLATSVKVTRKDETFSVTHRELLSSVRQTADGSTGSLAFDLTPSNSTTFPWGNAIYQRFEWYECKGLSFEFVPGATLTVGGRMTLAIDYDPCDAPPAHREDMANWSPSMTISPWERGYVQADQAALRSVTRRYTSLGNGVDARWCSLGTAYCMWDSDAGAVVLGELYITTTFVLHTPQIEEPPVLDVRGVPHVTYIEGTAVNSLELIPYATTPATVVTNGSSAYSFVPSDGRSGNDSFCWVTFPHPGKYLIEVGSERVSWGRSDTVGSCNYDPFLQFSDFYNCLRSSSNIVGEEAGISHGRVQVMRADTGVSSVSRMFGRYLIDVGYKYLNTQTLKLGIRWAVQTIGYLYQGWLNGMAGGESYLRVTNVPDGYQPLLIEDVSYASFMRTRGDRMTWLKPRVLDGFSGTPQGSDGEAKKETTTDPRTEDVHFPSGKGATELAYKHGCRCTECHLLQTVQKDLITGDSGRSNTAVTPSLPSGTGPSAKVETKGKPEGFCYC
jgi:hypothetical protein